MTNSSKQPQAASATKNPNTQESAIVEGFHGFCGNSRGGRLRFTASSSASSNSIWSSSALIRLRRSTIFRQSFFNMEAPYVAATWVYFPVEDFLAPQLEGELLSVEVTCAEINKAPHCG